MPPNGERLYANDEAARLTGFANAEELMSATPGRGARPLRALSRDGSVMRPDELPGQRALAGEEPEPTLVRFRRGSDRRERVSRVTAVPIKDAQGD